MKKNITILEAYQAMYKFIDEYFYRKGKPDELALLLADIELLPNGTSMDPAMWPDWLDAVENILKEE